MITLVIGDTGQDGRILSKKLQSLGYKVLGVSRSRTVFESYKWPAVNLDSQVQAYDFLNHFSPALIFHVAAIHGSSEFQPMVIESSREDMYACHVSIMRNIVLWAKLNLDTRVHVALSSQMYTAHDSHLIVNEKTPTSPSNFYGETKAEAWTLIQEARDNSDIKASASILFNHASVHSRNDFVFSQLRDQFVQVLNGKSKRIVLRNPLAKIDMTSAHEICDAILQNICYQPEEDFVFASGKNISLSSIVSSTINHFNLPNSLFECPEDLNRSHGGKPYMLKADARKAQKLLGWKSSDRAEEVLWGMIASSLQNSSSNGPST